MANEMAHLVIKGSFVRKATSLCPLSAGLVFLCLAVMAPSVSAYEIKDIFIQNLQEEACIVTKWEQMTTYICHRSKRQIESIEDLDPNELGDPDGKQLIKQVRKFAQLHDSGVANLLFAMGQYLQRNTFRSINKEYFVAILVSSYDGCSPLYRPEKSPKDLGQSWRGGFYNPCGGDRYDLSGRVFRDQKNKNNWNLLIPPYRFVSEKTIRIGELPSGIRALEYDFSPDFYSGFYPDSVKLFLACVWGEEDVLLEILNKGIDPDAQRIGLLTPLHAAVLSRKKEIVRILLDAGANPEVVGIDGLTPAQMAEKIEFTEGKNLLEKAQRQRQK